MERYLDNYTPHAKRQCVEEEDVLSNVEVNAIVYAYCQNVQGCARTDHVPLYDSSIHGKPVYVGQTIQEIVARDKQHVYCTKMCVNGCTRESREWQVNAMRDLQRFPNLSLTRQVQDAIYCNKDIS
tara:strand:+ start:4098 stop:4475 length:378 start_codon:yes stop_codon:yes gene_type:complete